MLNFKNRLKKTFFLILGFLCLGMAYVGVVTPGMPYSIFVVGAAYCFSKSSERMHRWIYNHKLFGPFLTNWNEKRVFPTKMKFFMLAMMGSSLIIMWFTGVKPIGILSTSIFMAIVAVWAWRFPGSIEEWQYRIDNNKKIGWLR